MAIIRISIMLLCLLWPALASAQDDELATGGKALQVGDYAAALAAFERSHAARPSWQAASGAGIAACELGQHERGQALLREAATMVPKNADADAIGVRLSERARACAPPPAPVVPVVVPVPVPVVVPAPVLVTPPPTDPSSEGPSAIGIAGVAVGGGAIVVGVALWLAADSRAGTAVQQQEALLADPQAPPIGDPCGIGTRVEPAQCGALLDALQSGQAFRGGSIAAFVGGGAMLVGGVIALVLPTDTPLEVSAGLQGLQLRGAW